MSQQVLVKISGVDAPGITAAVTSCFEPVQARLLDIEQAVTHGLLSLMVLLDVDETRVVPLEKCVNSKLQGYKLEVKFDLIDGPTRVADTSNRYVATVIASEIPPALVADLTATIAQSNTNIDSIRKLSSSGVSTIELICSSKEKLVLAAVKERLMGVVNKYAGIDIAIQKENIYRRSKRLVVFDMDSTLIQGEIIDELAARAGKKAEVSAITKRAMEGEIDFQESLLLRVGYLKGLTKKDLEAVHAGILLSPGANRLVKVLKRLGYKIAIISGGFSFFTDRLKSDLGIHYAYSNTLDMEDDVLTGRLQGTIVDGRRKADLLDLLAQQEGIFLDQVIAIGDGANDILMLKKAGLGIAFNAKPFTKAAVGTSIDAKSMESILYLLGINDAEIEDMGIR